MNLLFNPDKKDKQALISEFVIRTRIFDEIFSNLKSAKMTTPEQHYLLIGQRGAGKTTLLLRLKYAVEDDPKLSKWLIPVIFSEEQYNISEIANLWERIAEYLEDYHGFEGISEEMESKLQQPYYEEALFNVLLKHLDKRKKKIVLLIDNIGLLLAKFRKLEVHRLREILQTIPHIRLISASPVVLDSVLDYQQPLYEFFRMIWLKDLTDMESIALLRQLAVIHHAEDKIEAIIKNSPSRISTLRVLSGGTPRTMSLLFDIFLDNEHGTALSDLEKVLDAATPLYKHRMDDLPAQQQKIVDAVALHWEAISVKELAKRVRLDSKLVSAQLRQLEINMVIEKRSTDTKNHIYLLRERFFNIWYLMRYGRKQDRGRVIWMVKFLEEWCDKKGVEKRVLNYINKVKKGLLSNNATKTYGEPYSYFNNIASEIKYQFIDIVSPGISKEMNLTDEEFYDLLNKKLANKDYHSFINIGANRSIRSVNDFINLLIFFEDIFESEDIDVVISQINERFKIEEGRYGLPPFFFSFFIGLALYQFVEAILHDNEEFIIMRLKHIDILFSSIVEESHKIFFGELINVVFISIATEYYSLADRLIKLFPTDQMDRDFLQRLNKFIRAKQNKEELSMLGMEMVELTQICADEIQKLRESLKL